MEKKKTIQFYSSRSQRSHLFSNAFTRRKDNVIESSNTTRSNYWQENSAAARCETTSFSPSEPKLKKRRLYVRDVYNKCIQLEKKTSEKRTKKQNQKIPSSSSSVCAFKNKQFFHAKKKSPFPAKKRTSNTQLFYQQHTQRQQQQQ